VSTFTNFVSAECEAVFKGPLYSAYGEVGSVKKGRALDIAPQVDIATSEALRYTWRAPSSVARTCLIPFQL